MLRYGDKRGNAGARAAAPGGRSGAGHLVNSGTGSSDVAEGAAHSLLPVFDAPLGWDGIYLQPDAAWNVYLPLLSLVVATRRPRCFVELGAGSAVTFGACCQALGHTGEAVVAYSVGPWDEEEDSGADRFQSVRADCLRRFPSLNGVEHLDAGPVPWAEVMAPIELLHLVGAGEPCAPPGLEDWLDRLAPGAVVLATSGQAGAGAPDPAVWELVADRFPSHVFSLETSRPSGSDGPGVGLAQVPDDGRTPLVDLLTSAAPGVRALFALLGQRAEYRHLLGPEPAEPGLIRSHLEALAAGRDKEVATYRSGLEALRAELEQALAERDELGRRLAEQYDELTGTYSAEIDLLSAKVAATAARYSAQVDEEEARHQAQVAELVHQQVEVQIRLEETRARVADLESSTSWRVTAGLRWLTRRAGTARAPAARRPRR